MSRRILVARLADAKNLNSQCTTAQNILSRWRSTDYRPSILASSDPNPAVAANPVVDIIHLPPNRLWRAALFAAYMRSFDGIFYPGLHHRADWLALKTREAIGYRVPVIVTVESILGNADDQDVERRHTAVAGHRIYCGNLRAAEFRRYDELCMLADHIIAISPFLAKLAKARYGEKVSVLPLGADNKLFRRDTWERRTRPRVIGAATVYARKRPELFLDLAAKFPNADFVWFGDGDLRAKIMAEIARRGLNNLQFAGAISSDQLAKEMSASDIFVLPSFAEGVPKATAEAAAAGLAQIIFGFYEASTVVDTVNGFVVWSDEELSDRLSQLLADPDLRERMGRAGRRVAETWSWDVLAPKWEQRIIEICSRGPAH